MERKFGNKSEVSSMTDFPTTNEERKQQLKEIQSKLKIRTGDGTRYTDRPFDRPENISKEISCAEERPMAKRRHRNGKTGPASPLTSDAKMELLTSDRIWCDQNPALIPDLESNYFGNGREACHFTPLDKTEANPKFPSKFTAIKDEASMQLGIYSGCNDYFIRNCTLHAVNRELMSSKERGPNPLGETVSSIGAPHYPPPRCRFGKLGKRDRRSTERTRGMTQQFLASLTAILLVTTATFPTSYGSDLFSRQRTDHDACSQQTCSASYTNSMQYVTRGSNPQYCSVLKTYLECMRQTSDACKGNLYYHSMSVLIINWMTQYNCSAMGLTPSPNGHRPGKTRSPVLTPTPTALRVCTYKGERNFKHCGLFGDPHLRTFSDEFQTCKVEGAWPLIDNDYLVVQVTNAIVVHQSRATATSKLTVIIKGNTPCSEEKTYQATIGNLPSAFIDGHVTSGPDKSVQIVEMDRGRHIEIHIRYVATTVIVRQVGQFLTFAIRMPEIIIEKRPPPRTNNGIDVGLLPMTSPNLQLCVRGCPSSERINYKEFLSYPNQKLKTLMRHNEIAMTRELAILKCREADVVDQYFDSCVFDLMTTGDANFTLAASSALKDVRKLHPGPIFKNRTSLSTHYQFLGNSGAATLINNLLPVLALLSYQLLAIT